METQANIQKNHIVYQVLGWIFLGLVFAAVVSGVYYQQMKNLPVDSPIVHQDPYAGWKVYKDEKHGFEFKYPGDWTALSDGLYVEAAPASETGHDVYLSVNLNSPKTLQRAESNYKAMRKGSAIVKTEISFAGLSAVEFRYADDSDPVFFMVDLGERYLEIRNYRNNDAVVKKILKSFAFTGQDTKINSYSACVAAGYPVMKSLPEKCQTSEGLVFVNHGPCIQVIQKARNPKTGEVREFATPCDVPEGWEKLSN
jgi:hypothetical protein